MDYFAERFERAIAWCMNGHANYATSRKTTRYWDAKTPYAVHPVWCVTTFLQETRLSGDASANREECALALLFHDFVEDTTMSLPEWLPSASIDLIRRMTFSGEVGSTEIEMREIWTSLPIVRLLKLYDKVSNLLDGTWMPDEKWNAQYVPYVLRLASDVEKNYGDLNIVRIARAIAVPRSTHRA